MTALLCQVTCALCQTKIDETKWKRHLTSSIHLQKCKNVDISVAKNLFQIIFEARPEKKEFICFKKRKKHTISAFWRFCFSTKLAKEKLDTLCNDSINKLEKKISFV